MENTENLCRLCCTNNNKIMNIFDENGIELNIATILTKHFWFEVLVDDGLSDVICTECWWFTDMFHRFYNTIEMAYANLKNVSNTSGTTTNDVDKLKFENDDDILKDKLLNKQTYSENIDTKIKIEDEISENESITANVSKRKQYKKEGVSNVQNMIPPDIQSVYLKIDDNSSENEGDNCHNTDENEDDDIDDDNYDDREEEEEEEEEHEDEDLEDKNEDGDKSVTTRMTRKRKIKTVSLESDKQVRPKRKYTKRTKTEPNDIVEKHNIADLKKINSVQRKLLIEKEDAQIREYFKMDCDECEYKFLTYLEAKMHYRTAHQRNGYITCCGRKFSRRGRILDHILRHLNPDAYKCALCHKIYADKSTLKYHIEEHKYDLDKPFKCDTCPRTFLKPYQLTQHQKLRHNTKKFECDECGKSFPSKPNLSVHIKFVHQSNYAQICDICARVFKSKQVLKHHRLTHFAVEVKPKLQCNICGAWLKHEHSLRTHLTLHKDTVQKCPICNKETQNRQSLRNHMRYVHSERRHECKLCNKAFKQPIGLKEHMASHTGEDLYTCPYCPKTFKSGANMHSHRKKVHPEEWERDRTRRNLLQIN